MMARMKELEAENAWLKKMYIEEKLKAEILNEAISRTWDGPTGSIWVPYIDKLACTIFSVSETCYRYEANHNGESELIANWLIRLTDNNPSWGFGLYYLYLRNVKHFKWNHKRIYRITTKGSPFRDSELELNLRIKPRKRLVRDKPDALVVPLGINQVWSRLLPGPWALKWASSCHRNA